MAAKMTNSDFDKTLNGIAIDTIILTVINLFSLIIFGTVQEHGDQNAGSMYGFYIIPVIPVILLALGLIQASQFYLKPKMAWLTSLTPMVFILFGFWLDATDIKILITVLAIIIIYSLLKGVLKGSN